METGEQLLATPLFLIIFIVGPIWISYQSLALVASVLVPTLVALVASTSEQTVLQGKEAGAAAGL
jgi:hypothetical protein